MQYFINSNGTTTNLITEPIYQGSVNANEMVLVAPFSPSNQVTCTFVLPNGIHTEEFLMTLQGKAMNIEGITYHIWRRLIDGVVTEYAGQCEVQFTVYQGAFNDKNNATHQMRLKTYTSNFTVGKGATPNIFEMPPSADIYQSILSYLAELNPQYNIENVYYSTDDEYKIDTSNVKLTRYPSDSSLDQDVSFEPSNIGYAPSKSPLYALNENYIGDTYFAIDFVDPVDIGKMQVEIYRAFNVTKLNFYVKLDGALDYLKVTDLNVSAPGNEPTSLIVNVGKSNVVSVKIEQPYQDNVDLDQQNGVEDEGYTNGRFYVYSIDMWKPNTKGYTTITSSTGRSIIFGDLDLSAVLQATENARDETLQAQSDTEQAKADTLAIKEKASDILSQMRKNVKNGVAGLDGNAKIFVEQIPNIATHDYFEVASENDLTTLTNAKMGDIAYDLNENGTSVADSWILLGNGDYSVLSNWKRQGVGFSERSQYANQSGESENTAKINGLAIYGILSETDFEALPNKDGVYFVALGE